MKAKQECRNCSHWEKISGTKKHKTEMGLCEFMNKRIHIIWETSEPERDKNNKSLVINSSSEISGEINGLHISSTSKNLINRIAWVWTDAGFYCACHKPIQ